MDKTEILEKSQPENRGQDVANIEIFKSGAQLAWAATICLASAVRVVDALAFDRACYELLFASLAGLTTLFAYKYRIARRRHELLVMVCCAIASAAFLVVWIPQIVHR